ncbi:MAG: dTMP kinase [Candidatus Micrarchaeota archaeon]|nr:dTMP kinase [Candidatus Micrarchaeota archaeon]
MTGKLIVFEGLSAAGKNTQVKRLVESLNFGQKKAVYFAFPDYQSPTGQLIAEYLAGKFGPKENLAQTAALLYALDRYQDAGKIRSALSENDFVVLDRYTPANLAFQGALVPAEEKQALWDWIDAVEKNLPTPDAIVFLDVPRDVTQQLIQNRVDKNPLTAMDIHESDAAFEERVRKNYAELAQKRNWAVVECVKKGRLLSPDEVHALVVGALRRRGIL